MDVKREPQSQSDQNTPDTEIAIGPKPQEIEEFLEAAMKGDVQLLEKLLSDQPLLLEACDEDGYRALHRAAYEDFPDAVQFLLDRGASVHARTLEGWTPLHSAARWNAHRALKLLLAVPGAPVNAETDAGLTPLHCAAQQRDSRESLILLLLHPGRVDPEPRPGFDTAFELAGRNGPYAYLFDITRPSINNF